MATYGGELGAQIQALYQQNLGRVAAPEEIDYYYNAIVNQGVSPAQVATNIALSPEAQSRNALAPAAASAPAPVNALAFAPAPAAPATGTGEYWRSSDPRWSQFKPTGWGETEQPAQTYQSRVPPNLLYQAAADLGYTGPMYNPDLETGGYAPEFEAFWAQKRAEGYDLAVKHPDRGTVHSYFALVGPGDQPIKDYQVKEDALEVPKLLAKTAALVFGVPAAANALGLGTGAGAFGTPGVVGEQGAFLGEGIASGVPAWDAAAAAAGVPLVTPPPPLPNVPGATPPVTPGVTPPVTPPPAAAPAPTAPVAAPSLGQIGQAAAGAAQGLADSSIWGPLISSLASLYGGEKAAAATERAAQLQAEAANRAIGLQERMYQEGVARQAPFLQEGTAAFNRLAALQRGGPEAAQQFLTMEPGYGFRLGEGLKALERTQAARGNLLSGGAIKAGQRYAQDVASQEYSNAYNRLAQMAGIGPQAAGVANTLGQTYASNVGNLATQQGAASANALLGGAAARQSAYGDIGEAWGRYFAPQPMNYLAGGQYGR